MMRAFTINLPNDGNFHNLYSLIVGTAKYGLVNGGTNETGITGAVPTDGILPDMCSFLQLSVPAANGKAILLGDRNNANTSVTIFLSGAAGVLPIASMRNTIELKDYFVALTSAGASNQLGVVIEIS